MVPNPVNEEYSRQRQSVCERPKMGHSGMVERKAARVLGSGF